MRPLTSFDSDYIQQLREVVRDELDQRWNVGKVEKVGLSTIHVRLSSSGTVVPNVRVMGGVANMAVGDDVYLLRFMNGDLLALNPRQVASGASPGTSGAHTHDGRYYTRTEMNAVLATKADVDHTHAPTYITATGGTIGGFHIRGDYIVDLADTFGLSAKDSEEDEGDPEVDDVRFWAGATFANRTTALFRVYESGKIVATAGEIAGWGIYADRLAKDTGSNATSAGLAPNDYPFFAGATYANRANAPFRVTPDGSLVANDAEITGTVRSSNYQQDLAGWIIDRDGDAEFNSVKVRGELHATTFVMKEASAVGGTMVVAPAGVLHNRVTTV